MTALLRDGEERQMGPRLLSRGWISTAVHYSTLAWTIFCIVGTWFVILKYGILPKGLFAVLLTFFFATILWVIPFAGLILLSLFVAPSEEASPSVAFKDLIKRGMKRSLG